MMVAEHQTTDRLLNIAHANLQDVLYEKNKNKIRFKNEKQKASSAYPSLPPRNRGTSALRHSPRKRIKDPKTGTSVQFYYILSITRERDQLGFRGESNRA